MYIYQLKNTILLTTANHYLSLNLFADSKVKDWGFPGGASGKESACQKKKKNLPANAGDLRDVGLIPGSGRSPGGGHDNPLWYSCLENPTDRGAWWAIVHRGEKGRT